MTARSLRCYGSIVFKRYNQMFRERGGNDFEVEHMEIALRQERGKLATALKLTRGIFNAVLGWWVNVEDIEED